MSNYKQMMVYEESLIRSESLQILCAMIAAWGVNGKPEYLVDEAIKIAKIHISKTTKKPS